MKLPGEMKIAFTEQQIADRVAELGKKIHQDFGDKELNFVVLANGGIVFASDLMRKTDNIVYIDTIRSSSYAGTVSKALKVMDEFGMNYAGKNVILVDDILDSGKTLRFFMRLLLMQKPASLKTCVFLDKSSRHGPDIRADYCGFVCLDQFVFGYGMDDAEQRYRNLPFVAYV